ncbi:hypothetical protein ACOMHN_016798 [Nucella lapillus]
MALRAPDTILPHREGHAAIEACRPQCGCAEVAINDSVGDLSTPLHRCKGRHHLPIIGEEMQGDQLPKVTAAKPDSIEVTRKNSTDPCGSNNLDPGESLECPAQSCDAVLQSFDLLAENEQPISQNLKGAEEDGNDVVLVEQGPKALSGPNST